MTTQCKACGDFLLFDGTTHHCRPDAVPVTLAMDAEGRVALTTEQAAMLSRYFLSDDGADGNELAVALDHAHNSPELAFARWVRRWAPVVAEREALRARVAELTDELADVRESERAFKSDRDDALDRARHHQRRRIEAVKRAQAAERAARRGGTLRAAVSPRADTADMYRVPGWAVRAYDAHGGAGQVPR